MVADRGRITLPDVMFVLGSMAVLGALWPVVMDVFTANADSMRTGTEYLYLLVLPTGILTLLSVIYVKATAGVR